MRTLSEYFDEDDNFRQRQELPLEWMDTSGFRLGMKVRWLQHEWIACDGVKRELKGQVGEVVEIHKGRGRYPSFFSSEVGVHVGQSTGCLYVRFPYDIYGKEANGISKPRVCHLNDQGITWEVASEP